MKIFINNINTYSGSCLCETLDIIQNEKCEIYGTLINQNEAKEEDMYMYNYNNVKKIVSKTNKDKLVKYIVTSNLCVFDMHNTGIEEIEYVIRKLKNEEIKTKVTFILVSSIMTWNKTKRKFVKKKIEEKIEEKIEQSDNVLTKQTNDKINSVQNCQKNNIDKYRYIPEAFSEKDYLKRIPSSGFKELKTIEILVLSLNSIKNINTYVVASGILYGNGENVFFPIFKNAWFGKDNQIIDKGNNFIPVIHVKGLCEYVKNVFIYKPEIKYLIAVDQEYVTQKDIIKSVANYISANNNYLSVSSYDSIFIKDSEKLCINLRFQCTRFWNLNQVDAINEKKKDNPNVLSSDNEESGQIGENSESEENSENEKNSENKENSENGKRGEEESCIKFHCQDGFVKNISILTKEFCEYRNLKSLKIMIMGPPGVGKTFIGKKICEHYNLKICSIQTLLDECKKTNYKFPEYYTNNLNDVGNTNKLNLNDISSIFYKKLKSNECKFRGYVLDSFPRNYYEAKMFFEKYFVSDVVDSSKDLTYSKNETMKKKHKKIKNKNEKRRNSNESKHSEESEMSLSEEETESKVDDESEEDEHSDSINKKTSSQSYTSESLDELENEDQTSENGDSSNEDRINENTKKNKKYDIKNDSEENKNNEYIYNENKNMDPRNNPILPEFVIILKSKEDLCRIRMMNL